MFNHVKPNIHPPPYDKNASRGPCANIYLGGWIRLWPWPSRGFFYGEILMAKEIAPAFQVYAADFMNDIKVQLMLPDELGVYWALLCFAWIEDGLPDDLMILDSLAFRGSRGRLTGSESNERSTIVHRAFNEIWEYVKQMFYLDESDGRLRNKRQEEIREEQRAKRPGHVKAGIESGRIRRKIARERTLNKRSTNVAKTLNTSTSSSTSSSKTPPTPPWGDVPRELLAGDFVEHWKGYLKWRSQVLRKPWADVTIKTRLKSLAEMGPDRAIAAMKHCMGMQYQGLFEEGANGRARSNRPRLPGMEDSNDDYDKLGVEVDV